MQAKRGSTATWQSQPLLSTTATLTNNLECMFVWYAVPVQSTIIIHVSNYKTMCQVSSVHDRPRSIINYLFGSFLTINIRLSVVCTSRRFFRDLLCSAAPATVRCRLGGLRTSSWSWTRLKMHGFIHGRAIPGAQHSRYAHRDEFLTFSSGLCVYATMWWTRGRSDLWTCWGCAESTNRSSRRTRTVLSRTSRPPCPSIRLRVKGCWEGHIYGRSTRGTCPASKRVVRYGSCMYLIDN